MRKKLMLSFLMILLIETLITVFFPWRYMKNLYLNTAENGLVSNGKLISKAYIDELDKPSASFDMFAKTYSGLSNARVTIIGRDGTVIGDSYTDSSTMENHSNRPEVKAALSGDIGKDSRYSTTEKREMTYAAVPVIKGGSVVAVIRLSVPLAELQKIQDYLLRWIVLSGLVGLLFALTIAFTIAGHIAEPINEIMRISSEIAGGRYDKRIKIKASGEVGELADSFNNMAGKLEITISDLSDQKNKLEAILESMQSGVIALDTSGRIMLANSEAVKIFGFEGDIIGRHILEVVRNIDLDEIIKSHSDEETEISISYPEKKELRVKAAPIKGTGDSKKTLGIVVVFQDITELRNLEKVRSEFVANVSHELRTPLTSIKGFIETLKNGAINDSTARDKFLDIIDVEADRLNRLITDLLTISELENKKQNVVVEDVDLNLCIDEIKDMMEGLAAQKNINLIFDKEENIPFVSGNYDKVKQLLINLIDNGIKYTPKGGRVQVKTYTERENVLLNVSDNGIGISKEHMPRLFERFYRVDKGRSRALGGTGLGLAIVKHIVANMNGSINVISEPGKGTSFIITMPKA